MDPAQPKNKYLIFFKGVFISFAHPCGNPKIYLCIICISPLIWFSSNKTLSLSISLEYPRSGRVLREPYRSWFNFFKSHKGTASYMSLSSLNIFPRNISTSCNLARLFLEARNMTNIQISQWNLKHTFIVLLVRTEVQCFMLGVPSSKVLRISYPAYQEMLSSYLGKAWTNPILMYRDIFILKGILR